MKSNRGFHTPLYYLALCVLSQCIAGGVLLFCAPAVRPYFLDASGAKYWVFLAAGFALYATVVWITSLFLQLPTHWRIFNALSLPLVIVFQVFHAPSGVYGIAALIAAFLYLPTFWTRVPYYPSSQAMYEAVLQELPQNQTVRFIDLGCGFSGLLCFLAEQRPESTFVGVELSPLAYILSRANAALHRTPNVTIYFRDFWKMSLKEYDVVYAFLAPPPMAALWDKVHAELSPKAILLVNSFPVPGIEAKQIEVKGNRQATLFRYQFV